MKRHPALVVLGAGLSQRFGPADKLAEDLGGKPVAHHALETLSSFAWDSRILVCRPGAAWAEAYWDKGFQVVENDAPEGGMLGSLHRGIARVADCPAVMMALADMPLIPADHIKQLREQHCLTPDQPIATGGADYKGPPAIFPTRILQGLPLQGEGGARSLLGGARLVAVEDQLRLDIDTAEGLAEVREHLCLV